MIKVLLTGGGTGGHIFPLLAIADEIKKIDKKEVRLFYFGPESKFDEEFEMREIKIYRLFGSKLRRYFALENFLDFFKFFVSLFQAFWRLYFLMPDIVFSKGGPGAFAVILAAKFYLIPVIIHESDSIPGLTNRLSAPLADRVGISFESAAKYFSRRKTAMVGNPVRSSLFPETMMDPQVLKEEFGFSPTEPVLLVLGGSQGASRINSFVVDNLLDILPQIQIFHQTGTLNFDEVRASSRVVLEAADETMRRRYRIIPFFDAKGLGRALWAADAVLSRSGAGAIYEIAAFGKPAILVPLPESANDHQKENAYEYARHGGAVVIEESNFRPNIVLIQVKNILQDAGVYESMVSRAKVFFKPDAAKAIAEEILKLSGYYDIISTDSVKEGA